MKTVFLMLAIASFANVMPDLAHASVSVSAAEPAMPVDIVAHGGGCRKSSPPGQCCHMDRKAGTVHCH